MKKFIIGALALIALLIIVLVAVIARQPDDYKITRSASIGAPSATIFEQVNDFHKWDAWSPWAKLDPGMKVTYSGPSAGVGSTYSWTGNSDVGEGKMAIAESRPSENIRIDLEFLQPFASKALTDFSFKPSGDKTDVVWTMNGKHNFISKAMCLVVSMDSLLGPDLEKGLANLKAVAEAAPKP